MATHYPLSAACHRPLLSFHSSSSSSSSSSSLKPSSSKTKKNHSPFSSAILLAAGAAAGVALAPAGALSALEEPANALSLPTWAIHVPSVVEWIAAMVLVWQYGDKSGLQTWKGLSWGMVPPGLFNKGKAVNKGNVYMSPASPPSVATRYFEQFREDFSLFLTSRSQELVAGGRIVFSFLGRKSHDSHKKNKNFIFEALGKSLSILVSQKLVEEEKVDSFNLPVYTPSMQELEDQVYKEGSFTIDYMKQDDYSVTIENADPKMLTRWSTAIFESLICHHFGEEIIKPLFETLTQVIRGILEAREDFEGCQFLVVLSKSAAP